ncbi:aminoglycoside phosphotransferase family protein [Actinotalea sp. M2MS4P-6]|uniref:aminoglycoside phosphotransferase family protein n=1 Tax=Actinotalea sp. M2MS4P-6 TaxID=2983762 RepID=UPI0021E41CC8|nr:aminoglycoside phosphotransferase family protein [Actinotalea sp. M2MS4P-6]MCV2393232.1 aminoglycoside phosphotransferase family protein [Actinotalea sp. M2MS4P-6]
MTADATRGEPGRSPRIRVPDGLLALPGFGEPWQTWLDALPRSAADLLDEWALTPDGDPTHGRCSLVVPVRTADGDAAVIKLGWPHEEARHEALALQRWHGQGAVLLLRADPHRWALLLERAHPRDLTTLDDVTACEVTAGLLSRLHRPAPPQLGTLSRSVARWTERLAALPRSAPVPHRMVEQAVSLGEAFAADPETDGTLIHTDAHYENVLAADREPWLVIDPKPLSGDPHYEVAPLLWNRWDEVAAAPRPVLQRRLDAVVDVLGLDRDRTRDWVVLREVCNALWTLEDAERLRRPLSPADRDELTRVVTIVKAVQD